MPKRYALLVGIDLYLNDGSRKSDNGRELALDHLRGCVNDVKAVRQFLHDEYEFDEISVLTSSSPGDGDDQNPTCPAESPDRWPTFSNIQREFEAVLERAIVGDFFFFHYSGHGGRLKRVKGSPKRRMIDPSLLTVDFCCGQPAVRGWQLNWWLKKLNNKGVQVVVALDSCHSGGSWRSAGNHVSYRTPNDWPLVPSLPADEQAAAATAAAEDQEAVEGAYRDAELEVSWSINPEAFTLMAACGSDEKAAEKVLNGKVGGAFTHELLDYLRPGGSGGGVNMTYRMISDQLTMRLEGQTPAVYGRDRLLFFGNSEPFSVTPVIARVEGDRVIIPAGIAHGVNVGSEFTIFPETFITFLVDEVDEFECSATAPDELSVVLLRRHRYAVAPSRWSLGEETLQVLVDPAFGLDFQGWLRERLESRIASHIMVLEHTEGHADADTLRLERWGEDDARIWGPEGLIGYDDPVRPLSLKDGNPEELAAKAAPALAHLARFRQILDLGAQGSPNPPPFEVSVKPVNAEAVDGMYPLNQKFKFVFNNRSDEELHFTIMVLSPEFSIEQLYPLRDHPQTTAPGGTRSFTFSMTLPSGPDWVQEALCRTSRRDIIRTMVTRGRRVSWKSLELPNIWDASPTAPHRKPSPGRGAIVMLDSDWWAHDERIITGSMKSTLSPSSPSSS